MSPIKPESWNDNLSGDTLESTSMVVTSEARAFWLRNGFLPVPGLFATDDIVEVAALLQPISEQKSGSNLKRDDLSERVDGHATSLEVLWATRIEPRLRATRIFRQCQRYASALLDMPVEYVFDHVIWKPPGIGTGTRWHQDCVYAYEEPYLNKQRVHFWIPMADVPIMGGAMRYVPGSQSGPIYEHQLVSGGGKAHYLMATGFDDSTAVDVPIPAGGAILHHPYTLHASGVNILPHMRTAWILHFARPRTFSENVRFKWLRLQERMEKRFK